MKTIKILNDSIGNRTHELPACGVVPRPTLEREIGHSPMKSEQTDCSETLVFELQTPENNAKENV
jgi:hypothetical protein